MKIEVGGFYKTRDGRKVGPMLKNVGAYSSHYAFYAADNCGILGAPAWTDRGSYWAAHLDRGESQDDLVALWQEELKVGDRVRFTDEVSSYWWFSKGQEGTIVGHSSLTGYLFDVKVDGGADRAAHVNAEHLQLIPSAPSVPAQPTTPAIVAVIINGKAAPNRRPKVHASVFAAEQEADRLAARHPGQQFDVYVRSSGRVADVTLKAVA